MKAWEVYALQEVDNTKGHIYSVVLDTQTSETCINSLYNDKDVGLAIREYKYNVSPPTWNGSRW